MTASATGERDRGQEQRSRKASVHYPVSIATGRSLLDHQPRRYATTYPPAGTKTVCRAIDTLSPPLNSWYGVWPVSAPSDLTSNGLPVLACQASKKPRLSVV